MFAFGLPALSTLAVVVSSFFVEPLPSSLDIDNFVFEDCDFTIAFNLNQFEKKRKAKEKLTRSIGDNRVAEIGLDALSDSKLFDPILKKHVLENRLAKYFNLTLFTKKNLVAVH